jgi:hypothetical protein
VDDGFSDAYARPAWVTDNVVRFATRFVDSNDGVFDRLSLVNESGVRLPHVLVEYSDVVLAIDSGLRQQTDFKAPRNSTGFIYVETTLDGCPQHAHKNMFLTGGPSRTMDIGIRIGQDGIDIRLK